MAWAIAFCMFMPMYAFAIPERMSENWIDLAVEVMPRDGVYEIYTAEELAWVAKMTNETPQTGEYNWSYGKQFSIMQDIDLSGREWTPIGYLDADYPQSNDRTRSFRGSMLGNGHVISGMSQNVPADPVAGTGALVWGLFGTIASGQRDNNEPDTPFPINVKDLHVTNAVVHAVYLPKPDEPGASYLKEAGWAALFTGINWGVIEGCSAAGTVAAEGVRSVAGFAGINPGALVSCRVSADVTAAGKQQYGETGMLTAESNAWGYYSSIYNCYAEGTLQANVEFIDAVNENPGLAHSKTVGGMVAYNAAPLSHCVSNVTVSLAGATPTSVGAVAGKQDGDYLDAITNCFYDQVKAGSLKPLGGISETAQGLTEATADSVSSGHLNDWTDETAAETLALGAPLSGASAESMNLWCSAAGGYPQPSGDAVAAIGAERFAALSEAFQAAAEMEEWNGQPVERENPVEMTLLSDTSLDETIIPKHSLSPKYELTWHIRLKGGGKTVGRGADFGDALIHVTQGSSLFLEDIILDGAADTKIVDPLVYLGGTGNSYYPVDLIKSQDNYAELGKGTVLKNNHSQNPGGGAVVEAGTLVLDGGTISDNSARSGGGVQVGGGQKGGENDTVFYPAQFIMNSGLITGNRSETRYTYGGGVNVQSILRDPIATEQYSFVMNGGIIENNIADEGGAVALSSDNVQISGGTIQNNACPSIGTTGIFCAFGSSVHIGGAVTILDQIGVSWYEGKPHGKILVDSALELAGKPLALRVNSSNAVCPDGTVLAEAAAEYGGSLSLSDFVWQWDNSGYENTRRSLVADGGKILAGTLKTGVQKGSTDITCEYGTKLGELDFSGCEIYDETEEQRLTGTWEIQYKEGENAETIRPVNEDWPYGDSVYTTFAPDDKSYGKMDVTFYLHVNRKTPAYTAPTGLSAVFGQTLADVSLPAGFTWQDGNTAVVGNAGENHFKVTYTPEDTETYRPVSDIDVTITVAKASPAVEGLPKAGRLKKGSRLSGSVLSGGTVTGVDGKILKGTWAWKENHTMASTGTFTENVVFTPLDANYRAAEAEVTVTVYQETTSAGTGGNRGGSGFLPGGLMSSVGNTEDTDWKNPFADVTESDWFYDAVRYVYQNGLFGGVSQSLFDPNGRITRGMLVTVLYRTEGKPEPGAASKFEDVPEGAYYADAVAWAAENGIVKGYTETEFAPEEFISREQIAAVLHRYAVFAGNAAYAAGSLAEFADRDQISPWAMEDVVWAVREKLIQGNGGGLLNPQGTATRAETSAMLQRYLES